MYRDDHEGLSISLVIPVRRQPGIAPLLMRPAVLVVVMVVVVALLLALRRAGDDQLALVSTAVPFAATHNV